MVNLHLLTLSRHLIFLHIDHLMDGCCDRRGSGVVRGCGMRGSGVSVLFCCGGVMGLWCCGVM